MVTLGVAALSGLLQLSAFCCGGLTFSENHAIQLDGANGRVNVDPGPVGTPASVTVELWVRLDDVDRVQFLVTDAFNDTNDGFSLFVSTDNRISFFAAGFIGFVGVARSTTVLEAGRWYHVAGIYDADADLVKVVVDGVEESSIPYTQGIFYASNRELLFGMQNKPLNQSSRFLGGAVDEVRIWGVARTAEEIEEARGSELSEEVEGLLGYWPMNEGSGLSTEDFGDGGNHGGLEGGAEWVDATWASEPEMDMAIDILPGDPENTINMRSHGKIPVALLSTSSLDAVEEVDHGSLTFGQTGDEDSLHRLRYGKSNCGAEDVDGDGLDDLVCHFNTQSTGFEEGDFEGILKGLTLAGDEFTASDFIFVKLPGARPPRVRNPGNGPDKGKRGNGKR